MPSHGTQQWFIANSLFEEILRNWVALSSQYFIVNSRHCRWSTSNTADHRLSPQVKRRLLCDLPQVASTLLSRVWHSTLHRSLTWFFFSINIFFFDFTLLISFRLFWSFVIARKLKNKLFHLTMGLRTHAIEEENWAAEKGWLILYLAWKGWTTSTWTRQFNGCLEAMLLYARDQFWIPFKLRHVFWLFGDSKNLNGLINGWVTKSLIALNEKMMNEHCQGKTWY